MECLQQNIRTFRGHSCAHSEQLFYFQKICQMSKWLSSMFSESAISGHFEGTYVVPLPLKSTRKEYPSLRGVNAVSGAQLMLYVLYSPVSFCDLQGLASRGNRRSSSRCVSSTAPGTRKKTSGASSSLCTRTSSWPCIR